ncbi:Telomeric repeat-binding factor 2-interacting protein 1 [Frankliniella fusca]|nr:Telomeric repeat-binding factor 2-interacting protein 1 [Frankliniella fusca]
MIEYLRNTGGYEGVRGTAIWKRMSVKFPNHTWQSLKEHFIKKIIPRVGSLCRSAEELDRFRQGMKTSNRNPQMILNQYSEHEDNLILEYVSIEGKHAKLGGNTFWKEMQSKNIVPARTWHSIRERYLKYLRSSILSDGKYSGSTLKYSVEKRKTSQTEKHQYNKRQAARQARKSKKRKLFNPTDRFDSNIAEYGPVSEESRGPSVFAI